MAVVGASDGARAACVSLAARLRASGITVECCGPDRHEARTLDHFHVAAAADTADGIVLQAAEQDVVRCRLLYARERRRGIRVLVDGETHVVDEVVVSRRPDIRVLRLHASLSAQPP